MPLAPLDHVSASQEKTWLACRRKWWIEKSPNGPRLKAPETPGQGSGKVIHKELELYFKGGSVPTHPSAFKALEFLPDRADVSPDDVERQIQLTAAGVKWVGSIDLFRPPLGYVPHVYDYKTSSDPERYHKTEAQLAVDPQMISYAYAALEWFPHATHVDLTHVYIGKRSVTAFPITKRVRAIDVEAAWKNVCVPPVRGMKADAVVLGEQEIPRTLSSCDAYGGCPWRERCGTLPRQLTAARIAEGEPMPTLSELLNATNNASNAATATPAPAPAVETAALPPLPTGVLPPDAPAPVVTAPVEPPAPAPKTKKGRTAKKDIPSEAVETLSSTSGHTTIVVNSLGGPSEATKTPPTLDLYVNCVPVFRVGDPNVTFLSEIIEKLGKEIAEGQGVDDLDLIPYREGVGLLKAAIRKNPPTGVVVARSGYYEDAVLSVLEPLAWSVTKGVK